MLNPNKQKTKKGVLGTMFLGPRTLQSMHRRTSFLPPHQQGSRTPKMMPGLYFHHTSPWISQPFESWNNQESPFPLNFGKNEAQRSKMTLADTSGDSDHLQTAQLTVLHSSHTIIGLPELPLLKMTTPNMCRLYCFSSFLKLSPSPEGLGKLSLTRREQASPHRPLQGARTHTAQRRGRPDQCQQLPGLKEMSGSRSAASDLPLLQVCHVSALECSFQEVGELVVDRVRYFQVPGCGVTCDLGRGTQREPLSASSEAERPGSAQAEVAAPSPPKPPATIGARRAILRPNST